MVFNYRQSCKTPDLSYVYNVTDDRIIDKVIKCIIYKRYYREGNGHNCRRVIELYINLDNCFVIPVVLLEPKSGRAMVDNVHYTLLSLTITNFDQVDVSFYYFERIIRKVGPNVSETTKECYVMNNDGAYHAIYNESEINLGFQSPMHIFIHRLFSFPFFSIKGVSDYIQFPLRVTPRILRNRKGYPYDDSYYLPANKTTIENFCNKGNVSVYRHPGEYPLINPF